ncbi:ATP synthase F0 subunit B [Nocardioides sp. W7]|uniref:ATP synthase F0 subunit B n=1 Tax=Nocardioides sp. W7 TaxID=2931390 RepID=UPI001FD04257|nr:ATP synthase F0 subunit B [Nocardioides sp. W7]
MPYEATTDQTRNRAEAFRATLGSHHEADTILAEAAAVRREAGQQAERLVAEADELVRELTEQARASAAQVTAEARERADGILVQARQSAEQIRTQASADAESAREQLLAELEAENRERLHGVRHRAEELLSGLEKVVRGLGTTLQQAEGSVDEVERTLTHLRTETVARLPETPAGPSSEFVESEDAAERARTEMAFAEITADRTPEPALVESVARADRELTTTPHAFDRSELHQSNGDQRPLGWLFRSTR